MDNVICHQILQTQFIWRSVQCFQKIKNADADADAAIPLVSLSYQNHCGIAITSLLWVLALISASISSFLVQRGYTFILQNFYVLPTLIKGFIDVLCRSYLTGTVAYRAPELLKGGPPSARSDIFSYGVTLWQMMAREIPYGNENQHVVIFGVVAYNLRPKVENKTEEEETALEYCYR